MKKLMTVLFASLAAVATFAGNKCYWIADSGSGLITDTSHWINGLAPKSGNGDTVYITNNVEGTVISVADAGITLCNIMIGKSQYPIRFTGGKLCMQNGSMRIDVPITVDNDFQLLTDGSITPGHTVNELGPSVFNGTITLADVDKNYIGGWHKVIFNGPIVGPGAIVYSPCIVCGSRPRYFNSPVKVKRLYFQHNSDYGNTSPYYFNAQGNSWEICEMRDHSFHFGCVNAMTTNAPFAWFDANPGSSEGTTSYYLDGYDQIGNRIVSAREGSVLTRDICYISTTNACTLLLRGTASAQTDCRTRGALTLVWSPLGDFTQTFVNRSHLTTGTLVVSNGTLHVGSGASFASVPRIDVRGGRFLVDSAVLGSLSGVRKVFVEDDSIFEIGADASPFAESLVHLTIATDGRFKLPAGKTLTLASLTVNGEFKAAGDYTGEGGSEGTVLPQFSGTGKITVLGQIPSTGVTKTWKGGSGRWSAAANWEGGVVPENGDKVVLTASADGTEIENDLTGLCLEKITFTGTHTLGLVGNRINLIAGNAFENCIANVWTTNGVDMVLMTSAEYVFKQQSGRKCVLGGVISGPGRLTCSDSGMWYWIRENTFTGGLKLVSGQHRPFDAKAFGSCRTVDVEGTTVAPQVDGTFYDYDFVNGKDGFSVHFEAANNCSIGAITNNSTGTVWARVNEANGNTGTIRGEVYSPNGELNALGNKSKGVVHFAGRLNVKKVVTDTGGNYGPGTYSFDASGNVYGEMVIGWNPFRCGAKDALCATAPVTFAGYMGGQNEPYTACVDMNGYDQTVDRIRNDPSNPAWRPNTEYAGRRFFTAEDKPVTLMQRATAGAITEARFDGPISVVWNAVDSSYVWELTNHTHSLSGALIASNGVIRVSEGVKMSSLPLLSVGPQGEMILATTVENAFSGVRRIELAAGGKLTIGAAAFAGLPQDGSLNISLGTGSLLTLPADATLRVNELTVNGKSLAKNRRYSSGEIPEISGGAVFVTLGTVTPVPATWTGAGGDDTSADLADNWGGTLPDLSASTLAATFASGGSAATLPSAADYSWYSIAFAGAAAEDFELKAQTGAQLLVGAGGISQASSLTNRISASLSLSDGMKIDSGAKSRLEVSGAINEPNGPVFVTKDGDGTLALYGENQLAGDFAISNGTVEVYGTTNVLGEASSGGNVLVQQYGNDALLEFKSSGVIERRIVTVCANSTGALAFDAGTTNLFTKEVVSTGVSGAAGTGVPRYEWYEQACTIFEGGLDLMSGWFCPVVHGSGEIICRCKPAKFNYVYLQAPVTVRLQASGNFAGTIEFHDYSGSILSLESDGVFSGNPTLRFSRATIAGGIELNGHDVTFGNLQSSLSGYFASRGAPAVLGFNVSDNCTNENVRLLGEVSLRKSGAKSFTQLAPIASTGALDVREGEMICGPNMRWSNCTNVTVASGASLSFAVSPRMRYSGGVCMSIGDTASVELANRSTLHVRELSVGGAVQEAGVYGGEDCEIPEARRLDQLSGTGAIIVGDTGTMLIVR